MKKTKISSKSLNGSKGVINKSNTVTRAGITADIKLTRGKQLVEHSPFSLIPDPDNPRPGDLINEDWLNKYLSIGTDQCLCKVDGDGNYYIPRFKDLNSEIPKNLEEHYEFLRSLAYSIRNDGLIEPIEIFLADKNYDPDYFTHTNLEYGYVILEGHQRRLAGLIAGVPTLTCIEITDETVLARLKVKHRKLRRQLSENNLRKGLTVCQNYLIVKELLLSEPDNNLSSKELSTIIGLNEEIASCLKRLSLKSNQYPNSIFKVIEANLVSFKWIRTWITKSYKEIDDEANRVLNGTEQLKLSNIAKPKPRGRSGGAIKRSVTFKVNKENDSKLLQEYLFKIIPELKLDLVEDSPFHNLEKVLNKLMELARKQ